MKQDRAPEYPPGAAFDSVAVDYDSDFSSLAAVRRIRAAQWKAISRSLPPGGGRLLDLGCGTGEDALHFAREGHHVLATDASEKMLAEARRKAAGCGNLDFLQVRIEDLQAGIEGEERFGAILSNFGALNCLPTVSPVHEIAERLLAPGGFLFLCLINRFYPREILKGELRRLRPNGSPAQLSKGHSVRCHYHSIRDFEWPGYRLREVWALSVFTRSDIRKKWPLNRLGDHSFLILERPPETGQAPSP